MGAGRERGGRGGAVPRPSHTPGLPVEARISYILGDVWLWVGVPGASSALAAQTQYIKWVWPRKFTTRNDHTSNSKACV